MLEIKHPTVAAAAAVENRQKFVIGPLAAGFGYTIGNALRRTLLSSIPGAAVTHVRFDEALHEFDTLTGVVEDISDIILNLKDLVLHSHSPEPVQLRIDVLGPAEVTGAHFAVNPDVEVLNPELHVATLNARARFAADVTVERGIGYIGAESRPAGGTIGAVPVDALFSPVRRVSYEVEATPGERDVASDELVVDVHTDGTMTPAEAMATAGGILRRLSELVENLAEVTLPDGMDPSSAPEGPEDLLRPIEELGLSERPRNCLKRAQVTTVGALLDRTPLELLAIPNFGEKSLDEVTARLDELGLALKSAD
ncbi:MAG: DNA-directed RNA polymerase subunit alpha [bacterium]|nr:DNA-directed RNA polymerase subunit alpha [bacterium]MCY3926000.1 DNA-directed RNA polymerase subunit alpha [bacterium]